MATMTVRVIVLLLFSPCAANAQPSVSWLAPLVGVWATTDTYHPVNGAPIVENATRTCRAVMRDAYVECETVVARPDGTGRTYRFLINYNRTTSRFEMLSIWSNVPHKAVQTLTANATRDRWIIEHLAVIGDDGGPNEHWSELVIESPDRIVWTGRRVTAGVEPKTAPISFHETWSRRSR
jgi:hypothetical protein